MAALLAIAAMAWGRIACASIAVTPASPTSRDSLRITVGGGFPDLRWAIIGGATSRVHGDTVGVRVEVNYCGGAPGCNGGGEPVGYSLTCVAGPLAAGIYLIEYEEAHINSADPRHTVVQHKVLIVADGNTPVRNSTWGSLKSIYR